MSGVLTRQHLRQLAEIRVNEAVALLNGRHFSGAYYLAGYAVELAFKALIATQFVADVIPDRRFVIGIYTHDLEKLAESAGLKPALELRQRADAQFQANWEIVKNWNEDSRYEIIREAQARQLIDALTDAASGVFPWIQAHW